MEHEGTNTLTPRETSLSLPRPAEGGHGAAHTLSENSLLSAVSGMLDSYRGVQERASRDLCSGDLAASLTYSHHYWLLVRGLQAYSEGLGRA